MSTRYSTLFHLHQASRRSRICLRTYASKSKSKQAVEEYLKRQSNDYFSRLAKEHNYRARSAFKLIAINEKHNVINPGDVVVDIGAAPGSWSQVAAEFVFDDKNFNAGVIGEADRSGYVLGVDIQPIVPFPRIDFIGQGDITRRSTHDRIREKLQGRMVDAVISDMAPNPTGDKQTDHLRIIELCRLVLRLAVEQDPPVLPLRRNSKFLCKIFDGELTNKFAEELKQHFKKVQIIKPIASRDTSSEKYLLAKNRIT